MMVAILRQAGLHSYPNKYALPGDRYLRGTGPNLARKIMAGFVVAGVIAVATGQLRSGATRSLKKSEIDTVERSRSSPASRNEP